MIGMFFFCKTLFNIDQDLFGPEEVVLSDILLTYLIPVLIPNIQVKFVANYLVQNTVLNQYVRNMDIISIPRMQFELFPYEV